MSIRMQKIEYANTLPKRRPKVTRQMVVDMLTRRMKRAMLRDGTIQHTQKKVWQYSVGGGPTAVVYAHTRSEARAEIKKVLGIKKGRLPQDVEIDLAN